MAYGTPMQNQNKGYAAQEKKDLMKMPGDFKQMSKGSWMSKHVSSPLAMGKGSGMYMNDMAPKMEGDTPLEGNAFGKAMADNDGNYEAAKASLAPKMHGALHMDKGAPTKMYGGKKGDESAKTKEEVKKVKAKAEKDYK